MTGYSLHSKPLWTNEGWSEAYLIMITQEEYKPTCIYMQQINEIFLSYQNNDAIHLGRLFHLLKMETTLSIHAALKNQFCILQIVSRKTSKCIWSRVLRIHTLLWIWGQLINSYNVYIKSCTSQGKQWQWETTICTVYLVSFYAVCTIHILKPFNQSQLTKTCNKSTDTYF